MSSANRGKFSRDRVSSPEESGESRREERRETRRREPARKKKDPNRQARGFLILGVLALAGVLILSTALIRHSGKFQMPVMLTVPGGSTHEPSESQDPSASQQETQKPEKPDSATAMESAYNSDRINLLVGVAGPDLQTDTLLLMGIDTSTHELSYVSIPRETYISGNYDLPMVSQVYKEAGEKRGADALKEKYKEMFGFWVDYYMILEEQAVIDLTDLAGGVSFTVPEDLDYTDLHHTGGKLAGKDAVRLFQYRADYREVDLDAAQVQRDFIAALLEQLTGGKTQEELLAVGEKILPHTNTDLTAQQLSWFGQFLQKTDLSGCYHKALLGDTIREKGRDYYELDIEDTLDVMNIHFNPTGRDLSKYDVNLRQQSGGAGDGTVPTYDWQTTESEESSGEDSGESTEPDDTDDSESGDPSDSTESGTPSESQNSSDASEPDSQPSESTESQPVEPPTTEPPQTQPEPVPPPEE